ncbi:hydrolase [Streptomyces sp. NPDC048383]|uniref:hydrolase n=1 Tax=Streptomyces sp. NPDC048383 TaxID=3155386 RepID=UPI0034311A19
MRYDRAADPLIAAARAAAPLAAEHAHASETARTLAPPVAEAVIAAGFPGYFAPVAHGGAAGTFTGLLDAVAALGEGCTSAAWCASVVASAGRMTAYLPAAGQEAVWHKGPDTVVSAGLVPSGTAERGPGGWRLNGTWPYVSAVDFSDWTLVAARARTPEGQQVRIFAVPRTDYRIEDTWFTVSLRGTGSNSVVLDDVLVPDELSVPLDVLLAGPAPESDAACHQVPLKAGNGLTLAAPLLGATRGALRRWSHLVQGKLAGPAGAISGAQDAGPFEQLLARAEGETDAAQLLLERVARTTDEGPYSALDSARNGRDSALAADLLASVVDRLLRTAGTRAQAEGEELQRRWRDVNCGAGHSGLQFAPLAGTYARLRTATPDAV